MHLLLIRHGQSTNNALANQGGNAYTTGRLPDPELTELGHRQAHALADWIPGVDPRPTHIYCSPMSRTLQTAAPLADALDLPIGVKSLLHERPGPVQITPDGPRATPARRAPRLPHTPRVPSSIQTSPRTAGTTTTSRPRPMPSSGPAGSRRGLSVPTPMTTSSPGWGTAPSGHSP